MNYSTVIVSFLIVILGVCALSLKSQSLGYVIPQTEEMEATWYPE